MSIISIRTKKKIDEMIAVMNAYKEGKQLECRAKDDDNASWRDVYEPSWNFYTIDYRVKPEPKNEYVPYTSVLEVDRDKWVKRKEGSSVLYRINGFDLNDDLCVRVGYDWVTLEDLCENYTYEDGTPCGKLAEEVKKKG